MIVIAKLIKALMFQPAMMYSSSAELKTTELHGLRAAQKYGLGMLAKTTTSLEKKRETGIQYKLKNPETISLAVNSVTTTIFYLKKCDNVKMESNEYFSNDTTFNRWSYYVACPPS